MNYHKEQFCFDCPIRGTQYCHKVDPTAKRYTRSEKEAIRKQMDETGEFDFSTTPSGIVLQLLNHRNLFED